MGQVLDQSIDLLLQRLGRRERLRRGLAAAGFCAACAAFLLIADGTHARIIPSRELFIARIGLAALPILAFLVFAAVPISRSALAYRADQLFETGNLFSALLHSRSTKLTPLVFTEAQERAHASATAPLPPLRFPAFVRHAPLAFLLGLLFSFAPGRLQAPNASLLSLIEQAEALLLATTSAGQAEALPRDQRDAMTSATRDLRQAVLGESQQDLSAAMARMEKLLERITGRVAASSLAEKRSDQGPRNSGQNETPINEKDLRTLLQEMLRTDPSEWRVRSQLTELLQNPALAAEQDQADLRHAEASLESGNGDSAQQAVARLLRRLEERRALFQDAVDVMVKAKGNANTQSGAKTQQNEGGDRPTPAATREHEASVANRGEIPLLPNEVELTSTQRQHLDRYFSALTRQK